MRVLLVQLTKVCVSSEILFLRKSYVSTREAEAGGMRFGGKPGLHSKVKDSLG